MRTIGVVTVGRSDYGIYRPVLREIQAREGLELHLLVSGAHLLPVYGLTVREIEKDGFPIAERIQMLEPSDSPEGIARSIGRGVTGFAGALARRAPDILVLLGDRFEMLAAAAAALPFTIPIAHIHGGELTEGAFDDAIRHAITKMSHLHFVATETYRRRILQLGEEPWRVAVSGAPGLDNVLTVDAATVEQLRARLNLGLEQPFLLVTFHPVTLEQEDTERHLDELLTALSALDFDLVFTLPTFDAGSGSVIQRLQRFVASRPGATLVDSLGTQAYFGLMKRAAAMVGNSSSGIIEAASFKLPVVNIGNRQRGRERPKNVIDVEGSKDEILSAIRQATSREFVAELSDLVNPYGDGHAARRIVDVLATVVLDKQLITKSFRDLESIDG